MDEERVTTPELKRRDFVTSCLAFLTVATVGFTLWACGDEDLTFPGQIPFTNTPSPTQTGTPEEDDEDDEDEEVES